MASTTRRASNQLWVAFTLFGVLRQRRKTYERDGVPKVGASETSQAVARPSAETLMKRASVMLPTTVSHVVS
jgi:hypothetical protein